MEGGKIDMVLEKKGAPSIACEVSITNTAEYEVGNLQKCLRANYPIIMFVSPYKKKLDEVEALAKTKFQEDELSRIFFVDPTELAYLLARFAARSASQGKKTIRGYAVTRTLLIKSEEEQERKIQALLKTLFESGGEDKEK